TTLDNLLLLCRRHHRAVHEGGYSVDHDGRFYYPWGQPLEHVARLPRGDPDELLDRNRDLGIDDDTCEPGLGDPLDLAQAVDAFISIGREEARSPRDGPGYELAFATSS